jgi:hypothetical protein
MAPLTNRAAYLTAVKTPLEARDAPIPVAGPNEIIIKNAAIAINPLDWHMQEYGIFIQQHISSSLSLRNSTSISSLPNDSVTLLEALHTCSDFAQFASYVTAHDSRPL